MNIPTNCPSCDSLLERVKDQLFCRNSSCPAQTAKIVESFCKKMKIKGFGPKTIEKLGVESLSELYSLSEDYLTEKLGEKTATKLHAEIANKRVVEFGQFLGALGIPLIGTVAANKLGIKANSWEDVTKASCAEAGLGEKATNNLLDWMASPQGEDVRQIPITFTVTEPSTTASTPVDAKGDVVITGKLNDFKNRTEAAKFLEQHGYSVKSGVTKKTIALIVEDGSTSSKTNKANDLGIPILTIKELLGS